MPTSFSQTAAYIWSLADLLRGDFKQSQYGRVILPFTILRRLECVLEAAKPQVLERAKKLTSNKSLEAEALEKFLLKAAKQSFFNASEMDLSKLASADIKSNPEAVMRTFGQELNPESYAICKGDMLIKGQDVSRIKPGNTLSEDQLYAEKFDYMLSNPPLAWTGRKSKAPSTTTTTSEALTDALDRACRESATDRCYSLCT
jgi:type I restriction-modification system DNA methylase subunit